MGLPPRSCYPLDELAEAWGTTVRALLGYGVEGRLAISVLLFGLRVDLWQTSDGEVVPLGRSNRNGAHCLFEQDLWTINSRGSTMVRRFRTAEGAVAECLDGNPGIEIAQSELVITSEERARFEQANGIAPVDAGSQVTPDPTLPFHHAADYSEITLGGRSFQLSPRRAAVVRQLHDAWRDGHPWLRDHVLLAQAGSRSERLVDLFKPVLGWRDILQSDRKGNWRLRLPARPDGRDRQRHYRRPSLHLVR